MFSLADFEFLKECSQGNINNVKSLLLKGANIEFEMTDKYKPLHSASEEGHFEVVQYIKLY